ncbi:MAG: DUF4123 domain-containing protein [Deltaproteobacteria bacterium]|nr:DUF4123 domain-containing protein [Deltaproteobacteria bacterium]
MSTEAEQVLQALDPELPVYAILDGARQRNVRAWVVSTKAPSWCLYRGDIPDTLANAAPWLLRMGRGHDFTETFFKIGWRNAWGILLATDAPSKELYRHLRKFLKVKTEGGRIMSFRYYDPRVLRAYLPTCTKAELDFVFGPIKAFACESSKAGEYHVYKNGPKGLELRTLQVQPD